MKFTIFAIICMGLFAFLLEYSPSHKKEKGISYPKEFPLVQTGDCLICDSVTTDSIFLSFNNN